MNSALITISARTIGAGEVQTCSARDLHAHLEIKRDFNAWLKEQTQRARLVEGRDFVSYQDVGNPLSAERGVAIDRVRDPRFGMVNSYHESILEAVIEEFLG